MGSEMCIRDSAKSHFEGFSSAIPVRDSEMNDVGLQERALGNVDRAPLRVEAKPLSSSERCIMCDSIDVQKVRYRRLRGFCGLAQPHRPPRADRFALRQPPRGAIPSLLAVYSVICVSVALRKYSLLPGREDLVARARFVRLTCLFQRTNLLTGRPSVAGKRTSACPTCAI